MIDPNSTDPYQSAAVDEVAAERPQRIGRYWVETILGQGSFGRVYLAHDDQLQRLVAIEVPHARLVAQTSDADAYLTEARTVAGLDHPNIVPVYDVGSTEDFPYYIVSKFTEGSKLAQRIKDNQPSYYETTELVATVAETLLSAHRKGLVYGGGKDGTEIVLVVIEGRGYTWPGQQPPVGFIGKSAKNVSANDLMWESFQKYKLK